MSTAIGERRRVYPGVDQAICRAVVVLGAMASIVAAQAAGARPSGWVQALLIGLAVLLAARPESAAGVVLLVATAYVWSTVPDPLSPLVLVVAAGMVLVHVGALVAAQGPSRMLVDGTQAVRWLLRALLLWLAAAAVWWLDLLATDLPGGRLAYAAGLVVLMLIATATAWFLGPPRSES